MPLDTFTCGTCEDTFTDLNEFVLHKQRNCSTVAPVLPSQPVTSHAQGTEVIQLHMNESGEITGMTSEPVGEAGGDNAQNDAATLAFLNEVNMSALSRANLGEGGQGDDSTTTTHLIILNNNGAGGNRDSTGPGITLLNGSSTNVEALAGIRVISQANGPLTTANSASSLMVKSDVSGRAIGQENSQSGSDQLPDSTLAPPSKKRRVGRAKTGEGKNKVLEAVPPSAVKPRVPETNAEGKLVCPQCKRTFTKERHFNTHKCLASSSYVDITKKEIVKIDSGDEEEEVADIDAGAQDDEEEEFTAPVEVDMEMEREEEDDEKEMDKDESAEKDEGSLKKKRGRRRKRSSYKFDIDVHDENSGARQMKVAAESLGNLPIFRNDEDKTDFESCIDVDLSQVDHMFRIHIIEQELNELSGMVYNTPTMSSLSVYSCNVCEKVFKSLSHIRLHCVTHTDLKPFKCNKCNYSTNSKGNLYTHMRKHTGQFYRCEQCDFKTVNKSHLVEHQMTHDNRRSQCLLCQKDYSTLKSLINHIRKYHTDKKGKEYLQTFLQGRGVRGTTVIHQCHVCNRKFKKRIDRDRHLFIHDIKDLPHVQQCELCDYWASRRVYLDKHYLKHRVIYCCAVCDQKFLSTTRLSEHLTAEHSVEGESGTVVADSLLEECINRSLYLPEPLATTLEGSKYVNLPEELREKHQANQSKDSNEQQLKESSTQSEEQSNPTTSSSETIESTVNNQTTALEQSQDFLTDLNKFVPETHESVASQAAQSAAGNEESGLGQIKDVKGSEEMKDEMESLENKDWQQGESIKNETSQAVMKEEHGDRKTQGIEGDENRATSLATASPLLMLQNPGSDSDLEGEDDEADSKGNGMEGLETPPDNEVEKDDSEVAEVTSDLERENTDLADKAKATDTEADQEVMSRKKLDKDDADADQEEETEKDKTDESDPAKSTASKAEKIEALIKRLGYRKMSMEIFNKMRETFGTEECEYCGRLFYSKVDYEPHLRTHTGDKPFACANCSFRATTKDQLKKHSEREHEKVAFQCKECDFLAPTRTRLWNHQLKHLGISGLSCPECPNKFDGMKQLRAHILNAHQDIDRETLEKLTGYRHKPLGKMGRRSFKCPHCPRVFIRANSELQKHIWIHEGIRPFACPICPYACRSKNNLQAHMLRHSTEKPFSCSECGKEYKSKTALRWHVRSHKTGKLFKCDKCPYEATQSSHLKRHMETHDVLKRFICKHCDFSANTLGYMKIHYAKHHKGKAFMHDEVVDPTATTPEKRVYKCLSCGYLFGNLSDLKRHLKIRHHVQMQDIAGMEQMQISEVEVVQYEDGPAVVAATSTAQPIQPAGELQVQVPSEEGSMSLATVNLIQHIIGMSQQGEGQVRVVSEDGEPVDITPETIIVQQDGQLLMTNDSSGMLPGSQYVIQYYNPGEMQSDSAVVTDNSSNTEIQLVTSVADDQVPVAASQANSQSGQFLITSTDQVQLLTSDSGHPHMLTSDGQTQIITTQDGDTSQLITIDGEGQLLAAEGEGSQFVNSDLENYNSQLIISDPSEQSENLVIGEESNREEEQQMSSIEIVEGEVS